MSSKTITHKKESKVLHNAIAMATALTFTLAMQAAQSLENKITASSGVQPITSLTDKESQAVSTSAGRVLKHTEAARQKIADKNKDSALEEIAQGLKLINIIENTVPKHKVITDIKSDGITYHDEEEVAQRYVSVFNESYLEDIITPVLQANKVGKNKHKIIAPTEDFSMLRHTSMKLDVMMAKRKMMQARKELNEGKYDDADLALAAIQYSGIIFEFDEIELPLVEAADNLLLARSEAKEGKYAEALATLKLASTDLKKYEDLSGKSRAAEVKKLHKEIDKLTDSLDGLDNLKSEMKKVEGKISSWWDRTVKWFKK